MLMYQTNPVGVQLKPRPNDRNMPTQHIATLLRVVGSSLKMVKFEPTTPNMSQHGWSNARNMLGPKMLRNVVLTCCDVWLGLNTDAFSCSNKFPYVLAT